MRTKEEQKEIDEYIAKQYCPKCGAKMDCDEDPWVCEPCDLEFYDSDLFPEDDVVD